MHPPSVNPKCNVFVLCTVIAREPSHVSRYYWHGSAIWLRPLFNTYHLKDPLFCSFVHMCTRLLLSSVVVGCMVSCRPSSPPPPLWNNTITTRTIEGICPHESCLLRSSQIVKPIVQHSSAHTHNTRHHIQKTLISHSFFKSRHKYYAQTIIQQPDCLKSEIALNFDKRGRRNILKHYLHTSTYWGDM